MVEGPINMFLAFDGDSIGKRLELYLLENREGDIRSFSAVVANAIHEIGATIEANGGELIICAGDSVLAKLPNNKELNSLVAHCEKLFFERTGSQISSGVADSLRGALIALKIAKGAKLCLR